MPADEAFLQSISAPKGADAMVLRDSGGTVDGHALFYIIRTGFAFDPAG